VFGRKVIKFYDRFFAVVLGWPEFGGFSWQDVEIVANFDLLFPPAKKHPNPKN
jgi:hypothetical protein